jgi:hypothetical protein
MVECAVTATQSQARLKHKNEHSRSRTLDICLALGHDSLPRGRDPMREPKRDCDYSARLVRPQCRTHHIRIRPRQESDLSCNRLLHQRLPRPALAREAEVAFFFFFFWKALFVYLSCF